MLLSFHPCIEGDINIICAGRAPGDVDLAAIRKADRIICPLGVTEQLYRLCRAHCTRVFPNYEARFDYPGKLGQARLFQEHRVAFPSTVAFSDMNAWQDGFKTHDMDTLPFGFPFVLKFNWRGEGEGVFLLKDNKDLNAALDLVSDAERGGEKGFLVQAYIPNKGRTLRVVVIGKQVYSYWRIQEDRDIFCSNIRAGARIDHDLSPELQEAAISSVREFSHRTGVNLAGFDFLFQADIAKPTPLFLEINYFFGRRGLGGSFRFYELLERAVREWLATA